jgi:hypothetical protein
VEQLALENFHMIVKDIVDSVLVDIIWGGSSLAAIGRN